MAQAGIRLTTILWSRSCGEGFSWSLRLQRPSIFLVAGLLFTMAILSPGPVLQAESRAAFANVSPSSSGEQDLPDAPSESSIPVESPRSCRTIHVGDKFRYFMEPAFGPRSFLTNAFDAGIFRVSLPSHYPPEWRDGIEGFGRLYGDSFARNGAEGIGRFSASVLLHEDPRYQRSESTFFPARLGHSLLYSFVDKTDGGHATVAISNFTGAAAGGFIGNSYLPAGFDNLTHAGQRSTIIFGAIAVQNVAQEFAPELGRFLMKLHPTHMPMPPVWWTGDK
jgi:hypothetical protein